MLKIKSISIIENYKILCFFNNGKKRIFDLEQSLDLTNKYVKKILTPQIFSKVTIGKFGEIKWDDEGEIKDYDGTILSCEYDISPEFVYQNSHD